MGKRNREHIKQQIEKIANLINVAPQAIKVDAGNVVTTPEQLDKLLTLVEKRTAPTPKTMAHKTRAKV